ncbi:MULTISPECIES: helix-turn-helix domain-containing protein [Giesbergeria]|uniref:Helix-turn-helix domain-containing protein n=1 Tax=Giesbergeria sinuosa TaxID=80883 RepID=A0ABV9QHW6_9BURK
MARIEQVSLLPESCSTRDVAQALGLAVRSVQLMVDRGELEAWKTPGGHRRIARASVQRWLAQRQAPNPLGTPLTVVRSAVQPPSVAAVASDHLSSVACKGVGRPKVLLIEDSVHIQNLVRQLLHHHFPQVELYVADDGIVGLVMAGQLQPQVLLVDIVLPSIDGSTLISRWRSHPQFAGSQLIVLTGLDAVEQARYAFALAGVPVAHKPQLVQELPALLATSLQATDVCAWPAIGGRFAQ